MGLGPYDSWYRTARAAAQKTGTAPGTSWAGEQLGTWSGMAGFDKPELSKEGFTATSITADPVLNSPTLKVRASRYTQVVVEMRVSVTGDSQLFWTTTGDPGATEANSLHVATTADGQFHRYVFEVGKQEAWGGCLTGLRLDPAVAAGVKVEIRSVSLQ